MARARIGAQHLPFPPPIIEALAPPVAPLHVAPQWPPSRAALAVNSSRATTPTRARASPSRFARPRTHAHAASPRADDGHREPRNAAPLLPRRPHRPLRAPASAAEISSDPFVQSPGSPAADTSTTRQSTHGVEVLWPVACKQALPAAIFASPLRPERILRCIYLYFTADRGKVPLPGRPSEPRNGRGVRRQQRVPRRWRGSSCSVCGQFFRAPVTTDQAPSPGF